MSSVIQPKQVTPLPIGPGGNNSIKNQMNDTNTQLAMMSVQINADKKFDPPVPKSVTKQVIQGFCSGANDIPTVLSIIGSICIVYGMVAK
jgi:hypothetical protein|uniref:Uncharacterized protein n=1 Tax=viral metagenome TaxID=1070528 RepID=A0A6C0IHC0_9ZZZZ